MKLDANDALIYKMVVDTLADFIWVYDCNTRKIKYSKALEEITGYRHDFCAGDDWRKVIHPDDMAEVNLSWQSATRKDHPKIALCFRIRHANGSYIWLGSSAIAIWDKEQQNLLRLIGICSDITAKKNKEIEEKLLQDSYLKNVRCYEGFFNSVQDFIFITDEKGYIVNFNQPVRDRLHYGDELFGKHLLTMHPEDLHLQATENLKQILAGTLKYCPLEVVTAEGDRIPVESTVSLGELNGKKVMFGISRDVTERYALENLIQKTELNFRKAFDYSAAAMSIYSLVTNEYISVNKNFELLTGYRAEEVIGKSVYDLGIIPESEMGKQIRTEILEKGYILNLEVVFQVKNGERRTGLFCATLVELDHPMMITTAVDIEELKRHQQNLESEVAKRTKDLNKSVKLLSATLESLPDLMFLLDEEGRVHDYHTYYTDQLYVPPDEIVGKLIDSILPADVCIIIRRAIQQALEKGSSREETYSLTLYGEVKWFELSITKIQDESNLLVALARDITNHIQAEEEIRQSEAKYKALFNENASVMLVIDPETRKITDANAAACLYYGYTYDEICLLSLENINILTPEEIQIQLAFTQKSGSTLYNFKHRLRNGDIRDVEVYAGPIIIDGEERLYAIIHDVTDKNEAEIALKKNREMLASVIDGSNAGYWVWHIKTDETIYSERWAGIVGYTWEELQALPGNPWSLFCHPDDLTKSNIQLNEYLKGILPYYEGEARMRHKDGHWVWVFYRGKTTEWDEEGNPVRLSGTHIDISAQKAFETELLYRVELEKVITEATTKLVKASPAELNASIENTMELIGRFAEIERIHLFIFNQTNFQNEKVLVWCANGIEPIMYEANNVNFNEISFVMRHISAFEPFTLPSTEGNSDEMLDALHQLNEVGIRSVLGIPVHLEERLIGFLSIESVTDTRFWQSEDIMLLKNYCNVLANVIHNSENLKEITLAKAFAEESNKIKNTFLANMNHELRTPLNGLSSFLELLDYKNFTAEYQDYLDNIKNSTRQLVQLVDDMLSFNQLQSGAGIVKAVEFNLRELVEQIISTSILEAIRKGIKVSAAMESRQDWVLISDYTILKQILLALVNNAVKFTSSGSVEIHCSLVEDEDVSLLISIKDTGIGIPQEEQCNIFKDFYQIDSEFTRLYGGTGMGLAVVQKYVELLKGSIKLISCPGQGSEFTLQIPVKLPQSTPNVVVTTETSVNKGRILVAEDNALNLKMMTLLLTRSGYDVVTALNGKEAFDMTLTEVFDVILMDIQMPIMDGITATEIIRKYEDRLNRHTPIIAVTAHVGEYNRNLCITSGMDDLVTKPVNYDLLDSKMQYYMEQNRNSN